MVAKAIFIMKTACRNAHLHGHEQSLNSSITLLQQHVLEGHISSPALLFERSIAAANAVQVASLEDHTNKRETLR
jgi:hypothetical protein